MQASPRVLLLALPLFAVLGAISLWSRREPNRARELASTQPKLVEGVSRPAAEPQPAPALRDPASALPSASVVAAPSEDSLASEMHALEDSNPARALELARQGQSLWPNGPRAAEFAATEVKCLYRLGKPSEGRGAAETMVNKYVGSPWAIEVERQTGAHAYVNH
jgi:hypothetical protein